MGLSVGIAGLPNVGKSTLLNALTRAGAEASNYPFCTIEKNVGVTPVPDPDLDRLARILAPREVIPTTIRFVDIAGLVEGASKGEGLGNKFLGDIREADAILHVVRCFPDESAAPASEPTDPLRDVEIVETELLLADLETAERRRERWSRSSRTGGEADRQAEAAFARAAASLGEGVPIRDLELSESEREIFAEARFLTAKPCLYVANTGEDDPRGEGDRIESLRDVKGAERVLAVSARIEEEISELPPAEQAEFLRAMGLEETALGLVVTACYGLLNLITFYTIANEKLQAWQLLEGGTARQAAGKIHGDMERGFIRAEVMALNDLIRLGSRQALHDRGRIHTVGRDYEVRDKDVLQILFKA